MKFTLHLTACGLFMMLRSLILILAIIPSFAAENIKAVGAVSKANIKAIGAVAEANIKAFGVVDNTASGGFSPSSLPNLERWLQADSGPDTPVDDSAVTTWSDSSGNGGHFGQATSGFRPIYKTSIVNGLPVVRFDGSDDKLTNNYSGTSLTGFAVVSTDVTGDFKSFMGQNGSGSGNTEAYYWGIPGNTQMAIRRGKGDASFLEASGGSISTTTFYIIAFKINGTTINQWVNGGAAGGETDAGALNTIVGPMVVGAAYHADSLVDHWNGDIAEFIIYNDVKSNADMNQVGNYLETKYGITWTDL